MSLEIQTKRDAGVTIVSLAGRLILGEATNLLRDSVRELLKQGAGNFVVNLRNVSYIDSAGLGELVGCYTAVTRRGGDLRLAGVSERTANLLDVTHLSQVFTVEGADFVPPAGAPGSFGSAARAS